MCCGERGPHTPDGRPSVYLHLDPAATRRFTIPGEERDRNPHVASRDFPRTDGRSGLEGVTAAAGALGVGVVDREAGAVQAVDVVDLGAAHVLHAVGVDVHLYTARLHHLVTVLGDILPPELVREARAASPNDSQPQPPLGLALLEPERLNLLGGCLSQRHHSWPPLIVHGSNPRHTESP